jgi:hypothetical protein|tara:strand:- start:259 stop:534 length:276 start_codon:yes stop_codon:yes gene_type:complete
MTNREFIEACYDLAYASSVRVMVKSSEHKQAYDYEAGLPGVLKVLRDYVDKGFAWDTMWEEHQPNDEDEDTQADYDLREKMENYLRSCKHD